MEWTMTQGSLRAAIATVAPVVGKGQLMPILDFIRLDIDHVNTMATLTGSNMETTIAVTTSITRADSSGALCVDGAMLAGWIGLLSGGDVTFEYQPGGAEVHISAQGAEVELPVRDAEDFPTIAYSADDELVEVPGALVKRLVREVALCASKEDTRPILQCMLWRLTEQGSEFACTDGFTLALRQEPDVKLEPGHAAVDFLVPVGAMTAMAASLAEDTPVKVAATTNGANLRLTGAHIQIDLRLVGGTYPDFRRIIPDPKAIKTHISVPRPEFKRAMRQALLIAKAASVKLKTGTVLAASDFVISDSPPLLSVHASTSGVGTNHSRVPVSLDGDPTKVGLNPQYVDDLINSVDSPFVEMEFVNEKQAVILRPGSDQRLIQLVMPMTRR